MYTNLKSHGGEFRSVLDNEFKCANNVTIASGYTSLDILKAYNDDFLGIAEKGGSSRLLLGMAFYEGLTAKKLDAVMQLNQDLIGINLNSGVYVANGRRYHGKIYHFETGDESKIYVGSSNFSSSGLSGNVECTIPVNDSQQKETIKAFLENLYSPTYAVRVDSAEIIVPERHRVVTKTIDDAWEGLSRYIPSNIKKDGYPYFDFKLSRITNMEKSNLNIYFGKGRLTRSTGKVIPRPWYEIELIADQEMRSSEYYPIGDFNAYTDDGYIIPMRTQGDYHKNMRSKNSLQIFGIWLKGKLERSGALKKYEPVTLDVLEEYGNDTVRFYKMADDAYYMEF